MDIDSTGLLVLTQDGRVASRLIGPQSNVLKKYIVRIDRPIRGTCLERLRFGLHLDGRQLRHANVDQTGERELKFELQEGRKRQIRRMCELVGLRVYTLQRIAIGGVELGNLARGCWRYLRPDEQF